MFGYVGVAVQLCSCAIPEQKKNKQITGYAKVSYMDLYTITISFTVCAILTISNTSKFCIAGSLSGESTGDRWIPLTKDQ